MPELHAAIQAMMNRVDEFCHALIGLLRFALASAVPKRFTLLQVLPRFGFGTTGLGNLYTPISDEMALSTLKAAWHNGIRYFDTAPHYGVGLAEERLSRFLPEQDRSSFVLSTKVGRILRPLQANEDPDPQCYFDTPERAREWNFSRDGIRASIEQSLERLDLDSVDIAYLHDPDNHERDVYESGYEALAELRKEGAVKWIGAGMNQTAMLTRFVRDFELDVVLCAGRYTLLDTTALSDLLPACSKRGTKVVIGGAYNSGLLANPQPGAPYDYESASSEMIGRAQQLSFICEELDVPLKAAALQFPFTHPAVATVVFSGNSQQQVEENIEMANYPIPESFWTALQHGGLVDFNVALPNEDEIKA